MWLLLACTLFLCPPGLAGPYLSVAATPTSHFARPVVARPTRFSWPWVDPGRLLLREITALGSPGQPGPCSPASAVSGEMGNTSFGLK